MPYDNIVEVVPNSSLTTSLIPESDLFFDRNWPIIAIRKGIRSIKNLSPHYANLSYHRLSLLHYTCLSSFFYVSFTNTPNEALSHLEWRQEWLMRCVHFIVMALGNWSLFCRGNPLLGVNGCILLKSALMEPLVVSWHIRWQKVTLRCMDMTTLILSLQ